MSKTTTELAERQAAALAAIKATKEKLEQLKNTNAFLEKRVAELEAKPEGGLTPEEAAELKAELDKSNALLDELQEAVLGVDTDEPSEPANPEA